MKPYEDVAEIEDRLKVCEQCLSDSRKLRWRLQSALTGILDPEIERHFDVFEALMHIEMEELRFRISLERLLIGEEEPE